MLRKRRDLTEQQIFAEIDSLAQLGAAPLDPSSTGVARSIRLATQYRWWDCLLLASAVELNCTHFLSEDLQDGRVVEGVTILDPFVHRPDELFSPN
jgi:predicted nucleic acid-binding protein